MLIINCLPLGSAPKTTALFSDKLQFLYVVGIYIKTVSTASSWIR